MQIYPIPCGLGIAFLVENNTGLFLVDTGTPGEEHRVLAKIQELGQKELKLIWITHAHYDHYGSAAALRNITGAGIGVHPADAGSMARGQSPLGTWRSYGFIYPFGLKITNRLNPLPETPPDFILEDGQTLAPFGLNARILYTPGHTPGHTCLLLEDGTAIAGDLIGIYHHKPRLQRLLATDWNQLPTSLARLKAAQPAWLYSGHSPRKIPGTSLTTI